MKVNLSGSETIDVPPQTLWDAVIDPATLQKAVPGCRDMRAVGAADYIMTLDLKVAAVGGSFEGKIALSDMSPPHSCTINLSGEGSLGSGTGTAKVRVHAHARSHALSAADSCPSALPFPPTSHLPPPTAPSVGRDDVHQ